MNATYICIFTYPNQSTLIYVYHEMRNKSIFTRDIISVRTCKRIYSVYMGQRLLSMGLRAQNCKVNSTYILNMHQRISNNLALYIRWDCIYALVKSNIEINCLLSKLLLEIKADFRKKSFIMMLKLYEMLHYKYLNFLWYN